MPVDPVEQREAYRTRGKRYTRARDQRQQQGLHIIVKKSTPLSPSWHCPHCALTYYGQLIGASAYTSGQVSSTSRLAPVDPLIIQVYSSEVTRKFKQWRIHWDNVTCRYRYQCAGRGSQRPKGGAHALETVLVKFDWRILDFLHSNGTV